MGNGVPHAVLWEGPNTPSGMNVVVSLQSATITFSNVNSVGETTSTTIDPSTAGEVPGGFAVSGVADYQIQTTANFTGPVTIAFVVPGPISEADFNSLVVLHNENGVLVDVTASSPARDYITRTVYAVTYSFSPFYLVEWDSTCYRYSTRAKLTRAAARCRSSSGS